VQNYCLIIEHPFYKVAHGNIDHEAEFLVPCYSANPSEFTGTVAVTCTGAKPAARSGAAYYYRQRRDIIDRQKRQRSVERVAWMRSRKAPCVDCGGQFIRQQLTFITAGSREAAKMS
jgi:hypothetical protein